MTDLAPDKVIESLNSRIIELTQALELVSKERQLQDSQRKFKLGRIRQVIALLKKETVIGDARFRLRSELDTLLGEIE